MQNQKKKWGKNNLILFEISKNVFSKFSGRLLIGQNDSLDVLLLDEFLLQKKSPGFMSQIRMVPRALSVERIRDIPEG